MKGLEILLADRDGDLRTRMAGFFQEAGYRVETTDSAVHVFCTVLEKGTPVLLLGSDFDGKISVTDLIRLLRRCNRHLSIIIVSAEPPLPRLSNRERNGKR